MLLLEQIITTNMQNKTYNTADICEKAHDKTDEETAKKGIEMDCVPDCEEHGESEEHYTTEAQEIFDKWFSILEREYESNPNYRREE